jgi:hypothetical protein
MPRLKFKFLPDIPMPSAMAIKDTIGARVMNRTEAPVPKDSAETKHPDPEYFPADHDTATLVTSLLPNGRHMPVIDIDMTSMLLPSSTPGHYHLYINQEMTWKQFLKMLKAMTDAGVVQEGFYQHTKRRGRAFVRYPGVTKSNEAERIAETVENIRQLKAETRRQLREDGIL